MTRPIILLRNLKSQKIRRVSIITLSIIILGRSRHDRKMVEALYDNEMISEAAKLGYPLAMEEMAQNYMRGKNGCDVDYAVVFEFATNAAMEAMREVFYVYVQVFTMIMV